MADDISARIRELPKVDTPALRPFGTNSSPRPLTQGFAES